MIGKLEFDGFKARELLEAKGPGYCSFFNADGRGWNNITVHHTPPAR